MRWMVQEIESPEAAPKDAFFHEFEGNTPLVVIVKGRGILLVTPIPEDAILLGAKED